MNEFRRYQPGDVIERADLIRLRPGTIVKAEHDDRPTYVMSAGNFERYAAIPSEAAILPELPDEDYLVLYVPPVPLPKVGETVSREQLEELPRWSVVQSVDSDYPVSYQFVTRESDEDTPETAPAYNVWAGYGFHGDDHGLWQHARGRLTLLSVPVEPHKS